MKTLVAYFSAGGATAALAKDIAEVTGADLFEIKPVEPYTQADIRWTNPLARCNKEKIALFATSGGSDITKSPGKLQPLMAGEIIGSKLFNSYSANDLRSWVDGLV